MRFLRQNLDPYNDTVCFILNFFKMKLSSKEFIRMLYIC